LLAKDIPEENIKRGAIGKEQVYFATSPDNLSISSHSDKINLLRDQIFTSTGLGPAQQALIKKMQAEGAKIAIYERRKHRITQSHRRILAQAGRHVVQMNNADKITMPPQLSITLAIPRPELPGRFV